MFRPSALSPQESAVKVRDLALIPVRIARMVENEAGSHNILSRASRGRLIIGWCDSKDSARTRFALFFVNGAAESKIILRLTNS
ncbi:MAG: hypothetical protein DI540_01240 [Sphingobium sp.]|nr:MAG: hypothetical protein DI540_01240 [Sphingobium sp.]